jgi:hypothetical protein
MEYGPTPEAIRYAVTMQLSELNDEIRLSLLNNQILFFHSSSINRSKNKLYFAYLNLEFYFMAKNSIVPVVIGLSNKTLPVWFTDSKSDLDLYYGIDEIKIIVEHWILRNVTMI